MSKFKFLLIVVISFLALTGQAIAAPFNPFLDEAYETAVEYWGQEPVFCTSIDKEIVPDEFHIEGSGELPVGAAAWATLTRGSPEACVLFVKRAYAKPSSGSLSCEIMIHEVGHLIGLPHDEVPGSIMNAQMSAELNLPVCQHFERKERNEPQFHPRRRGQRSSGLQRVR